MTNLLRLTTLLFLFITTQASAQIDSVRQKIEQIISTKKAFIGVAINGNDGKDVLLINGENRFPMQSVFKFHIALAVLSQVDKGKLKLNQPITILKKDMLPNLYSPIRDKYPDGVTLTLAQILEYTVAESDNIGCDVLLKLIGGPKVVENYFVQNNFKNISIKFNEATQQSNWDLQFQNWTTPKAANEVLTAFYYNTKKLLSPATHAFIWKVMIGTKTGENRLRGQLPKETVIAHKTGSSGTNKAGVTAAVNDIGIVFFPSGKHFFISVFVSDSKEKTDVNEKIIADIGKVCWDYFGGD